MSKEVMILLIKALSSSILTQKLLLSELVLDSILFISVTTMFTLLFDIGQYLLITKLQTNFHKEFQYP